MMAEDKNKFGSVHAVSGASRNEVLDFAIAREVEAYDFYMKLAALAQRPQTVKVIMDLAVEEQQHKIRLEAAKAGEIVLKEEEVGNLGIADYVEDVKPTPGMSYTELLCFGDEKRK